MRDERWVNRFLFTWNDSLFFDPLDVYYTPRHDHFLAGLDEEVRSRFVRNGIWWSYRSGRALPVQGWKIHVSATQRNVHDVAAAVIGYLTARGIDFKIALDLNIFETLNSKAMGRGSGGKFITVYPLHDDEFRACLADLARLLDGAEGAYVLSDMRYQDCKALYFRYGQFLDTHAVDVLGRRQPQILGPDGPVADERQPGSFQPLWVAWPFSDWKPADDAGEELLGGRFRVTSAIQFSNSGGVYEAQDTENGDRLVVLKEARPYANANPRRDQDAVDLLAREWAFLRRLAGTGSFPAPIATFRHWEHHFIAEEFVDGTDMRMIMLAESPLVRPEYDIEQSRRFLRIFFALFRGLARAIQTAREHQVRLGDLTPANLIVDRDTYGVTVIDLESCRLDDGSGADTELQQPIDLYTPGFSHSRNRSATPGVADDAYALAVNMAYFIFPIAAMLYLREDVLGRYSIFTDGLGWPRQIHDTIMDLASGRRSLEDVVEFLRDEEQYVARVQAPQRPTVVEERLGLAGTEAGVAAFVAAVADTDRDTLFPVDPFAHVSNPLSLGFGASGVLWALHASGVPVQPQWLAWLRNRLEGISAAEYPAGLMSGLGGIAWAAQSLGLDGPARDLLRQANERASGTDDYTFYYGLSGLGMVNLHRYLHSHSPADLAAAQECARRLCDTAQHDGAHSYWCNEFATDGPLTGLGFGQAGVALFLLRMHQVTQDASYLRLGRRALAWEMANAEPVHNGSVMFRHRGTLEPYVEVGSAGVAQVLLRYGDLDAARTVLSGLDVGYSVLPGYGFGMSGVADAMLDAAAITGDQAYRQTALRQLDFVRKVFLFEPPGHFLPAHRDGAAPLAVPGEGLLRCSCDLMTGSAGVLRVLHRVNSGGTADFLLDEVDR